MPYRYRLPVVVNGVELWVCSKCKSAFTKSGFYRSTSSSAGIYSRCKKCQIEETLRTRDKALAKERDLAWARRDREKNPEKYRARERKRTRVRDERVKARAKLNNMIRDGHIERPSDCSRCGIKARITAHHEDYSKPMDVVWLCYRCHAQQHADERQREFPQSASLFTTRKIKTN